MRPVARGIAMTTNVDLVVVGGGIAGLTAAAFAARAGAKTVVLEGAPLSGGRARTLDHDGYRLNLGPHALFASGAGARTLKELGVSYSGRIADGRGGFALYRSKLHTLPVGLVSLLTTGLLPMSDKIALGKLLTRVSSLDATRFCGTTLRSWVEDVAESALLRDFLYATLRVATYANAPDRSDAGASIAQLQRALDKGVYYLDGGWQTLVDGLLRVATGAGARVLNGARVKTLVAAEADILFPEHGLRARRAILAVSPKVARDLGAVPELGTTPVRAACLDVALRELPRPEARFALGIDHPLYYSVHTAYADLAPNHGAVVHAAKYLSPDDEHDAEADRAELAALIERMQPGHAAHVIESRFSPRLIVSHALVTAEGRPEPATALPGVYLAGDWVGSEGMLADAAFASARRAVELALDQSLERAA